MSATSEFEQDRIAHYLNGRFEQFVRNRSAIEIRWRSAIYAVQRINEGYWKSDEAKDAWRSRAFFNFTLQKVTACYSIISDAMLVGGHFPLAYKLDEEFERSEGAAAFADAIDFADDVVQEQIERSEMDREFLRCVRSVLIYGTTWAKRVVKEVVRKRWTEKSIGGGVDAGTMGTGGRMFEQVSEVQQIPTIKFRSNWNIFWDVEADNLDDCDLIIERRFISPWELREMENEPGYIDGSIERILKEHAGHGNNQTSTDNEEPNRQAVEEKRRELQRLECWGRVPRKLLDAEGAFFNAKGDYVDVAPDYDPEEAGREVWIMAKVVGNHKVVMRKISAEDRPYLRAVMEDDIDQLAPEGIPEKIKDIQFLLNGAVRLFIDNKALAGNAMVAIKRDLVDGPERIAPGAEWTLKGDARSITDVFQTFSVADVGNAIMPLISLLLQFGDDESSVPKLSQGLQDPLGGEETATKTNFRAERAQKFIGSIIRNLDEGIIEPAGNWILEYDMLDPALAPRLGPFTAQATGFTSFQNRQMRLGALLQLLGLALNDPQGIMVGILKIPALVKEIARLSDTDADMFIATEEELVEIAKKKEIEQAQQQAQIETQQAQTERELATADKTRMETERMAAEPIEAEEPPENVLEMV